MSEHSHDEIPHLEVDETIPPRPEEEIADVARADPQRGVAEEEAVQSDR